jgi:hypothetical protein
MIGANIKLDLTEPANALLTPIARQVGETVSAGLELALGGIRYRGEKAHIERKHHIAMFRSSLDNKVSSIPAEHFQEPDTYVLGSILDAAKYRINEPAIREMFAALIAASADARQNGNIHHAFAEIIKEMSPHDAVVLSHLKEDGPIAEIRLYDNGHQYYNNIGPHDLLILDDVSENDFDANAISLNNLARLGILRIDFVKNYTDEAHYNRYQQCQLYLDALATKESNQDAYESVELRKGIYEVTAFGQAFKSICLPPI